MKKIPTLFERDFDGNRQVIDKVHPGCEWVQAGVRLAALRAIHFLRTCRTQRHTRNASRASARRVFRRQLRQIMPTHVMVLLDSFS